MRPWWLLCGMASVFCLGLLQACGGASGSAGTTQLEARPTASANALVGDPVLLDASGSFVPASSSGLSYNWSVTAPDGSAVALGDIGTIKPYFFPAAAGRYIVTLGITLSVPPNSASSPVASLNVDVAALVPPTAAEARTRIRALAANAAPLLAPDSTSPTVTLGTAGGTSLITQSRLLPWFRPEFAYSGAVQQAGAVYPDELFGANRAVSYSATARSGNYLSIDFVTDAISFEVFQKGLGYDSTLRVVVDGRLASSTPTSAPADGSLYLVQVSFSTKATRHIRLLMNSPYFGGIRVGPTDTISRPASAARLRTMFLGDSITEGTAGQPAVTSYAPRTAELLGWLDNWVTGVGFTGYLAAPAPKLTLRQRYAVDVKPYAPAVLVVAAGINDVAFTDAQVQAEATLLFDQIQADLPQTLVFVAGPLAAADRARPGINAALKAAAGTRSNFYWVPNVDEAWLNPGNVGQYISADVTHPKPAGIEYLAGKLTAFIKQAVP